MPDSRRALPAGNPVPPDDRAFSGGLHLALFAPEIPQNTGNVARLAAAYALPLHVVGEPAFSLSDKALRRAGLDYWPHIDLRRHASVWHLLATLPGSRLIPISTRGSTPLRRMAFRTGDVLAFGNESRGLPPEVHRDFGARSVRIEQPGPVRSLNLATAAGIVVWQALARLAAEGGEV